MMLSAKHIATIGRDGNAGLTALSDLYLHSSGDRLILLATTQLHGAGTSSYSLTDPATPIKLVDAKPFEKNLTYLGDPAIRVLQVADQRYIHHLNLDGASGTIATLSDDGNLGAGQPHSRAAPFDKPALTLGQFEGSGQRFIYNSSRSEPIVRLHQLDASGELTLTAEESVSAGRPSEFPLINQLVAGQIGDQGFLVAMSSLANTISVFKLATNGSLTLTTQHNSARGTGYANPAHAEIFEAAGGNYLIVGSTETSSLTMFRLTADGHLITTDHVVDERSTRFQAVTALDVVTIDQRAFIFAGGTDGGISGFTVQPDGRLLHLGNVIDTDDTALADITAIRAGVQDGRISLFVASSSEAGITQLQVDPGLIGATRITNRTRVVSGSGNDLLLAGPETRNIRGGDGDDILVVNDGKVGLWGDGGRDTFVLANNHKRTEIRDFDIHHDSLDLSQLGMIRSIEQVRIDPLDFGARLRFHDTAIIIRTNDGSSIPRSYFTNDMFPITHYLTAETEAAEQPHLQHEGIIFGTNSDHPIHGEEHPELISGSVGNDTVRGGHGADTIRSDAGDDEIYGGDGNDVIRAGSGSDIAHGGAGADYVHAGDGDDLINGDEDDDLIFGANGDDRLLGGAGNDRLSGEDGKDLITGGPGDDLLFGNLHNDSLDGESGNDTLFGGYGDDELTETTGINVLWGMNGNDLLRGGLQRDVIHGGIGNDLIFGGDGFDRIAGNDGADTIHGEAGEDRIWGGNDDDLIFGNLNKDTLTGGPGNDSLHGGWGDDLLNETDGLNELWGMKGDDSLNGGAQSDTIEGGRGTDLALGHHGNDRIAGNDEDDTLYGGDDADSIWGGLGNDLIHGNLHHDLLVGGPGNDTLYGGWGNDHIRAPNGLNLLSGGRGNDRIFGGSDGDTIHGGMGKDQLRGREGSDTIHAGEGDDTIIGGMGSDKLTGGVGADIFRFEAFDESVSGKPDEITDFQHGTDKIDLTSLMVNYSDDALSTAGGRVTWASDQGRTRIIAESGDDVIYRLELSLSGIHQLTDESFLL